MSMDRPKPYIFIIRGLQLTTVIERTFHAESDAERYVSYIVLLLVLFVAYFWYVSGWLILSLHLLLSREEWVAAIKGVSDNLADSQDVEMMERASSINSGDFIPEGSALDDLSEKFKVQGTSSSNRSGKKKVVCHWLLSLCKPFV